MSTSLPSANTTVRSVSRAMFGCDLAPYTFAPTTDREGRFTRPEEPVEQTTGSPIDSHASPTADTATRSGKATASFVVGSPCWSLSPGLLLTRYPAVRRKVHSRFSERTLSPEAVGLNKGLLGTGKIGEAFARAFIRTVNTYFDEAARGCEKEITVTKLESTSYKQTFSGWKLDEATLKRLRKKGASIALEAANPAYETRIFGPDQVQVQGVVVGVMRKY